MLANVSSKNLMRVASEGGPQQNWENDGKTNDSSEVVCEKRRMGLFGMVVNQMNVIVGAGILSLPFAISQIGIIPGTFFLLFGALCTFWGLHLLVKVAQAVGGEENTYGTVARSVGNFWLQLASELLVFFQNSMVMVVYLNVAAGYLVEVADFFAANDSDPNAIYRSRQFYCVVPWLLVAMPLTFPRKVTALQYTSGIAMLGVAYLTILVVVYCSIYQDPEDLSYICGGFLRDHNLTTCVEDDPYCCLPNDPTECCKGDIKLVVPSFTSIVSIFPTMMTAFSCANNIFGLTNCLRNPSQWRYDVANSLAIVLCLIVYFATAFGGYFTYQDKVAGDLLGSYPLSSSVTAGRIVISFIVLVSYPLLGQVARDTMFQLCTMISCDKKADGEEESLPASWKDPYTKKGKIVFYACTVILVLFTLLLSLLDVELTVLLNLIGSISVVNLGFTFPGIFYWLCFQHDGYSWTRLSCIPMMILGISFMMLNIILWAIPVLKLYRNMLSTSRKIGEKDPVLGQDLAKQIKTEFRTFQHEQDKLTVSMLLKNGQTSLERLRSHSHVQGRKHDFKERNAAHPDAKPVGENWPWQR